MAGGMGAKAAAAKKAGAVKKTGVTIPPTKRRANIDTKTSSLRSNRTTGLINMRKQKVKRDANGNIVAGSVLSAHERATRGPISRVEPDRKWFGSSKVIGQDAMQKFQEEMEKKLKDPYSILIKPQKLPLSLLEKPKERPDLLEKKEFDFKGTFGKTARRKRANVGVATIDELKEVASKKEEGYNELKDRNLLANIIRESDPLTMTAKIERDMTIDRKPFDKGQSGRIWHQLWKVIDSSDVILQVLDARDPMGTRSKYLENYLQKEKKFKHLIFVLNKVDLVPTWVTARWLQILSKDRPTVAFHASLENPFGKGNLINLLRQFSRLHGAVKGNKGKKTISVGLIGYPNVGKSSVINTIRAKRVCKVAPIPGETKVWQYVKLSKSIFMIDCPGVIHDSDHKNNDVQAVLKGVVRVERMGEADKDEVITTIIDIIKKEDLCRTYDVEDFETTEDFLTAIARNRGRLLRGNVPDCDSAAKMVIHDWVRGRLPWFNAPPFDSNQQFRDHEMGDEATLLRKIQNYSTFNIINEELKNKVEQEEQGIEPVDDGSADAADDDDDDDDDDDELDEEVARLNAENAEAAALEVDGDSVPEDDVAEFKPGDDDDDDDEEAAAAPPAKRARKEKKPAGKKAAAAPASAPAPVHSAWEALKAASAAEAAAPVAKKKVRLVKKKA